LNIEQSPKGFAEEFWDSLKIVIRAILDGNTEATHDETAIAVLLKIKETGGSLHIGGVSGVFSKRSNHRRLMIAKRR
jgi:hypothetical protein